MTNPERLKALGITRQCQCGYVSDDRADFRKHLRQTGHVEDGTAKGKEELRKAREMAHAAGTRHACKDGRYVSFDKKTYTQCPFGCGFHVEAGK